ncbi:MAG: endonuclease NucS domain-containing protein [Gammaproteobacteria bacterium]
MVNLEDGQVRAVGLDEVGGTETEGRLEELLVASPELLLDGLSLIGRQLPIEAGVLDLLGIDQDGRLVLLELKRGTLTRDAVAQILDYVSDISGTEPEQLARVIEDHSGHGGIEKIEDFVDWYGREFPNSAGPLERTPRMMLVGLGADHRARRVVNFLADSGIDIHLLTFHAFRSGDGLFLARQVETVEPGQVKPTKRGPTKEENREALLALAERQGVKELLVTVAEYISDLGQFYRWPGRAAYSFQLPERTQEGRPTGRAYVTLYVNDRKRGQLLLTLAPRSVEAAPEAVKRFLEAVPSAKAVESSWAPLKAAIDERSWPSIQEPLRELVAAVVAGWKRNIAQKEGGISEGQGNESLSRGGD